MNKYLIISHGELSKGMLQTVEFFLGKKENVSCITGYTDELNIDDKINDYIHSLKNEGLVIFTDILGGSVNQKMIPFLTRPETYIIAGFNFPLILQIVTTTENEVLTENRIRDLVNEMKESIVFVNDAINEIQTEDGDE